jgi:hypothetical protein
MAQKLSTQWTIAGIVFVIGAVLVVAVFLHFGTPTTGQSTGSRVVGQTIEVDDVTRDPDGKQVLHHATVDAHTGKLISNTTAPAPSPLPAPPICPAIHRVERASKVLRMAPHFGDADFVDGDVPNPPNTTTIDPALQPLGFLTGTDFTPWFAGDDALLIYDRGAGIARVAPDGKQLWLRPLGGTCELAMRDGDTLVITTGDEKLRVAGIDLATGAIKWSYSTAPP